MPKSKIIAAHRKHTAFSEQTFCSYPGRNGSNLEFTVGTHFRLMQNPCKACRNLRAYRSFCFIRKSSSGKTISISPTHFLQPLAPSM